MFDSSDYISTYSRADAILDGVLVDLSQHPATIELGIRCPIAMTQALHSDLVAWSEQDIELQGYQEESARAFDVLSMYVAAAKRHGLGRSSIEYQLYAIPHDGVTREAVEVTVKAVIHPGDQGEMVITLTRPDEV